MNIEIIKEYLKAIKSKSAFKGIIIKNFNLTEVEEQNYLKFLLTENYITEKYSNPKTIKYSESRVIGYDITKLGLNFLNNN